MSADNHNAAPQVEPQEQSSVQPQPKEGDPRDCWNKVGVYGNKSCPELRTFVHCRNCPVYSTAGLHLLQRDVPDTYRAEWTSHFARKQKPTSLEDRSAVFFKISSEWLALPTHALHEVAERKTIHSLPHRKAGILLGLANVRGELVTCISLGHLLRIEPLPSQATLRTHYRRLLVATGSGNRVAFPVDEVSGAERFRAEGLKPPPPALAGSDPSFIQALLDWQGVTVGLLDADLLFSTIDRNLT
jgi:chemotaxis-related protein WspD